MLGSAPCRAAVWLVSLVLAVELAGGARLPLVYRVRFGDLLPYTLLWQHPMLHHLECITLQMTFYLLLWCKMCACASPCCCMGGCAVGGCLVLSVEYICVPAAACEDHTKSLLRAEPADGMGVPPAADRHNWFARLRRSVVQLHLAVYVCVLFLFGSYPLCAPPMLRQTLTLLHNHQQ
jgi:hypothetical protein